LHLQKAEPTEYQIVAHNSLSDKRTMVPATSTPSKKA
jgi:hypothetical protein